MPEPAVAAILLAMSETGHVLVAYGSKTGSTAEIAARIGAVLRGEGFEVAVLDAGAVTDIGPYGAVVLGSALYALRWRKEVVALLKRHREELSEREVWLFHSGPVGDDINESDRDQQLPANVAKLAARIGAHGPQTFGGRMLPGGGDRLYRLVARTTGAGDWRDWEAIEAWARLVADRLRAAARRNARAQGA